MPRPDSEPSGSPLPPYWRAARFGDDEDQAGRVYIQAKELIRVHPRNDLSIYRAHSDRSYYVLALGEPPPRPLDRQLRRLLGSGMVAAFPEDLLQYLYARRQRAIQLGPWIERHHRDG